VKGLRSRAWAGCGCGCSCSCRRHEVAGCRSIVILDRLPHCACCLLGPLDVALNRDTIPEKYAAQLEASPLKYSYSMTRMRDAQGPSISKVAAGISLDRIEFSTLRIAERGMRKRSSCSVMSCVATDTCQCMTPYKLHTSCCVGSRGP
jgi:hypothetical protein